VWSWDITKLSGPQEWTYYYLYVVLDVFSRFAVGWMVARCENAMLAKQLIVECVRKHGAQPGQFTTHSDRGAPMTSKGIALLLADLGLTRAASRACGGASPPGSLRSPSRPSFGSRAAVRCTRIAFDRPVQSAAVFGHKHKRLVDYADCAG
jgi:hypothetical protein